MECLYFVVAFAALIVVGTILIQVRTRRIAASRPGENFDTFLSSFAAEEAPHDVLRAVYVKFQELCYGAVEAFPVRAADDIGDIYGMLDEDLDDAVLELLEACGRQLPPEEQLRRMRPVITVRDCVRFIAGCPSVLGEARQGENGGVNAGGT